MAAPPLIRPRIDLNGIAGRKRGGALEKEINGIARGEVSGKLAGDAIRVESARLFRGERKRDVVCPDHHVFRLARRCRKADSDECQDDEYG